MSTSIERQRGARLAPRWLTSSLAACALLLAAGCNGSTDDGLTPGDVPADSGDPLGSPTLLAVAPTSGTTSGGTLVTLTGTGFLQDVTGATTVTFDGVPATDVTVIDDATVTVVTPEGVNDQLATIELENSRGLGVLASSFRYLATASIVSDLNDDGIPDVVVSAAYDGTNGPFSGSVYVFFGTPEMDAHQLSAGEASVKLVGAAASDRFGAAIATGDINADGVTDLVVGAPRSDSPASDAGSVSIFLGPLGAESLLSAVEADILLTGEGTVAGDLYGSTGDRFGQSLTLGDVDSDDILDLLVGAPGTDIAPGTSAEIEDAGRAYVFFGGPGFSSRGAASAEVILSGTVDSGAFGSAVCLVDLDVDSHADVAIAAEVESPLLYLGGYVHVFRGAGLTDRSADAADLRFRAEHGGDEFGTALACGDINGDGGDDLVVGAPYTDTLGSATGRVYVFLGGPAVVGGDAILADVVYTGQASNSDFGADLAVADLDGDGFDDVLVGSPRSSFGAQRNGRVFAFYGAEQPTDELSHFCDVIYTGEAIDGERFGSAVEVLDCDGDGLADLMSAAVGHADAAGSVYVFRGAEVLWDTDAVDDDMTLTGESQGGNFGFSISHGK
jgi:hypothetical protein